MDKNGLQLIEVTKTYKQNTIIYPTTAFFAQGEVIALCGGNGAGKSTLLRMIAGMIRPTSGKITLHGITWEKSRKQYASLVGYMPDDFNFGHALTAKETILFYAGLKKVDRTIAMQWLDKVGLSQDRDKLVSRFSKGMRQRLLLAQAMLNNPALLLLDEPTNGLDPFWMDVFIALLQETKSKGQTVVFSTHQLSIAEAGADRFLRMKRGKIELIESDNLYQ